MKSTRITENRFISATASIRSLFSTHSWVNRNFEFNIFVSKTPIFDVIILRFPCYCKPVVQSSRITETVWILGVVCAIGVGVNKHYNDVIMSAISSQITDVSIACSTVGSGADQRKHQSSASLAYVRGIHR